MHEYPHVYRVVASGGPEGDVSTTGEGLPHLPAQAPPQFGGPEGYWSPETLLVASVVQCFQLTFRAIARASRLEWVHLECHGEGILERVDRVTRFTEFRLSVRLQVPVGTPEDRALRLLEKAEKGCLVTNSLTSRVTLTTEVETVEA